MFVCRRKILDWFLLRLFTFRLNLSWLGDVLASLGWKEIWGTWPPALDLDLALFISTWKIFMCGCKRHNSKRGSFWQASKRKFSQSEWKKMGYEEFFGYFRLFSKSGLSSKKDQPISFWKDSFLETIYSVISSSYSWILDSMLIIHLIRWFSWLRIFGYLFMETFHFILWT